MSPTPRGKLVVVLGMHRSGTSAITRSLAALGVELGSSLIPGVLGDTIRVFGKTVTSFQLTNVCSTPSACPGVRWRNTTGIT